MIRVDTNYPVLRARREESALAAFGPVFDAMADHMRALREAGAAPSIPAALRSDLRDALLDEVSGTAVEVGKRVARALGDEVRERKWDPDVMLPWLRAVADSTSEGIADYWQARARHAIENGATDAEYDAIIAALQDRASQVASDSVTTGAGFAAQDAAEANGADLKRWQVNSTNPRESHAALAGETVPIRESFSNGLRQPGARGPASETANCQCSLVILKGGS